MKWWWSKFLVFIFLNLRYVEWGVLGYNSIGIKSAEFSYGSKIRDKLGGCPTNFQNYISRAIFFKIDPHNDGPRGYFWGQILGVIFFCSDSFLKGFLI